MPSAVWRSRHCGHEAAQRDGGTHEFPRLPQRITRINLALLSLNNLLCSFPDLPPQNYQPACDCDCRRCVISNCTRVPLKCMLQPRAASAQPTAWRCGLSGGGAARKHFAPRLCEPSTQQHPASIAAAPTMNRGPEAVSASAGRRGCSGRWASTTGGAWWGWP